MKIPEISPLMRKWHPNASEEELHEYTDEFRAFLLGAYRVFELADKEGRLLSNNVDLLTTRENLIK